MSASPPMARCPSCHRLERLTADGAREVAREGGLRRPEGPPAWAAWATLRAAAEGEHRVVGKCAACGLPMVADADAPVPAVAYAIKLPDGELLLGEDGLVRLDGAPAHLDEAEARVHRAYPPPKHDVVADVVGATMALTMLTPVSIWMVLVAFITAFLGYLWSPTPAP